MRSRDSSAFCVVSRDRDRQFARVDKTVPEGEHLISGDIRAEDTTIQRPVDPIENLPPAAREEL